MGKLTIKIKLKKQNGNVALNATLHHKGELYLDQGEITIFAPVKDKDFKNAYTELLYKVRKHLTGTYLEDILIQELKKAMDTFLHRKVRISDCAEKRPISLRLKKDIYINESFETTAEIPESPRELLERKNQNYEIKPKYTIGRMFSTENIKCSLVQTAQSLEKLEKALLTNVLETYPEPLALEVSKEIRRVETSLSKIAQQMALLQELDTLKNLYENPNKTQNALHNYICGKILPMPVVNGTGEAQLKLFYLNEELNLCPLETGKLVKSLKMQKFGTIKTPEPIKEPEKVIEGELKDNLGILVDWDKPYWLPHATSATYLVDIQDLQVISEKEYQKATEERQNKWKENWKSAIKYEPSAGDHKQNPKHD